ncbi:chemotaxis protein CheD [Pseudodesulfovibrio sp.]|nr:chemotaxis protein CheD [Pseudodesulfovibrio sp.]
MSQLVVNISDMKYSTQAEDVIITYSLGSCLGVTAYDPQTQTGGMIHCLLPTASAARNRAQENPFMFVNTGVLQMVRILIDKGAERNRLVFKAVGGANMRNDNLFNTGARNYEALEKLLDHNEIELTAHDVGGTIPRTMFLHLDTGRVVVRSLGEEREL